MRAILVSCFLALSWTVCAQITLIPIDQRAKKFNDSLQLTLPFWDDFSTSKNTPDTLLWQYGADVYVNATLGENPPTLNVATFDGLRGSGIAHQMDTEFNGPTDSLVSHPIDLSAVDPFERNSVYLTFFWQARGNGEIPDPKDSIRVQFMKSDSTWFTVWSQNGGLDVASDSFQQEIIQVSGDSLYHENFRLKFQSFTSQSGQFDTWHIDYIYLNKNRNENDLNHFDRAMTGRISAFISPYRQVPAEHFFANPAPFLDVQSSQVSNLDFTPHPLEYFHTLTNLTTGEVYLDAALGNGGGGGLSPLEIRQVTGANTTINVQTNPLDSQVIETSFYYKTGDKFLFEEINGTDTVFLPIDLKVNDTIKHLTTLQHAYAYDDGTAEFAAAVNILRGQVAMRYILVEPDTLTHLEIYFPNIAPSANGSNVDLMVWDRLDDDRVLRRQAYTIQAPSALNEVAKIRLNQPVLTRDTVYVGFQQFSDNYVGIGFDRDNPEASEHIFTNTRGEWEQNTRLSGALMIRPVFEFDSTFILQAAPPILDVKVYPNPTSGIIHLSDAYDTLEVLDFTGRVHYKVTGDQKIDLSFLSKGIYLLRITQDQLVTTQKLILK